jgi:hypothetical protein
MNDPPRPPNVTNTTQLPVNSALDKDGTDSQVDTNSVNTDFSSDKIEKDTGPGVRVSSKLTSDILHTQTVIDSSWSES